MRPHGRFKLVRQQDIMHVDFFSSWNEEAAVEYAQGIRKYANEICLHPWAVLGDLRKWEMGTPESLKVIGLLAIELDALNSRHTALVVADNHFKKLVLDEALGQDAHRNVAFFDNKREANAWLAEEGYGKAD
jgi:hypothetical protein